MTWLIAEIRMKIKWDASLAENISTKSLIKRDN